MLRKADAQSYTLTIWELPNQILHAVLYGVRGGKEDDHRTDWKAWAPW